MCVKCRSKSNTVNKTVTSCNHMYNELINLDSKVVGLFKSTKDHNLLRINKLLREWVENLRAKCPDSQEYETLKEILENEYSISL